MCPIIGKVHVGLTQCPDISNAYCKVTIICGTTQTRCHNYIAFSPKGLKMVLLLDINLYLIRSPGDS